MLTLEVFSLVKANHWAETAAAKPPASPQRVPEGPYSARNTAW